MYVIWSEEEVKTKLFYLIKSEHFIILVFSLSIISLLIFSLLS